MMDDLIDTMNEFANHPNRRGERLRVQQAWKEFFEYLDSDGKKLPRRLRMKNMPMQNPDGTWETGQAGTIGGFPFF